MNTTTSGDEVRMLREKLRGHDCAGGPNECGDCCTCREAQARYAIDQLAAGSARLRVRCRVLAGLLVVFGVAWLVLLLGAAFGGGR